MENLTTINVLTLLPETKAERKRFAADVIQRITSGTMQEHEIKKLILVIKSAIDTLQMVYDNQDVKETAIRALSGEKAEYPSGTIEVVKVRKYKYDNDSRWFELSLNEKYYANKRKEHETMMKTLTTPLVDATTGEIIEPAVIESVSETIKVTLK